MTKVVTCPFCGLMCDDLVLIDDRVDTKGCARALAGYARGDAAPGHHLVDGAPAAFETAIARAAEILGAARQPLVGGLTADLAGIRAALGLADRIGAIVEPLNADIALRNIAVDQSIGRFSATFGEIANRADLIVILGDPPDERFPRFSERLTRNGDALYRAEAPRVTRLGAGDATIQVAAEEYGDAVSLLTLGARGRAIPPRGPLPIDEATDALIALGAALAEARYGAIIWDAAGLGADGDLIVEGLIDLIRLLNETTRCVGLPLGGHGNGAGAVQASLWQSGWPTRIRFAPDEPRHDPWIYRADRLLAEGTVDALLWIATLDQTAPPPGAAPVIALVAPDIPPPANAPVVIRVGVPGIDHGGAVVRSDGIVCLPLIATAPRALPSVEDVCRAILLGLDPVS